jgi:putative ABC transport system permease protein
MALGAQRHDILRVIGRQGFAVIAAGLTTGLPVAFIMGQLVGDFLVGVAPTDPITYLVVSVLLAMIALLATYVPVRRASHVDPVAALRHE